MPASASSSRPSSSSPSSSRPSSRLTVGSVRDAAVPDLSDRFVAALIDGGVVLLLSFLLGWIPVVGGLVGGLYVLVRDGVEAGPIRFRSVGKFVMGLRPQRLDGRPMDLKTSLRRNAPLGVTVAVPILGAIPFIGGLLSTTASLLALTLLAVEVYFLVTDDSGRRWGDRLGGTKVVES